MIAIGAAVAALLPGIVALLAWRRLRRMAARSSRAALGATIGFEKPELDGKRMDTARHELPAATEQFNQIHELP